MKTIQNYWGRSNWWWVVLVVGILMVISGFAYWLWPAIGYAVSSQIFGWMLVLAGIVQLCVSAGNDRPRGWGWWLAGGVIDLFIGFMLVRSVILSELVFPYFISIVFLFWGISAVFGAVAMTGRKYWWVYLINGVLLLIIGFFFLEAGYVQDMLMTSFLTSLAFIYWGFSLAMVSYDMRPAATK
ncbi:MAG: DUF308 domain-containing protein [Firmicutes bacterium]|nr:DUF308 domain-containing protein [Bacillota bacterium]MCM1402019.1 DUF308 domain-containing protein [Bacteroides sp.]MCM1477948.1 DUF308 domain-containing protein [Bacteroides sp.]